LIFGGKKGLKEKNTKNLMVVGVVSAVLVAVVLVAIAIGESQFVPGVSESENEEPLVYMVHTPIPTAVRGIEDPSAQTQPTSTSEPVREPAEPHGKDPEIESDLDKEGTLWAPYLEWNLENPGYSGNPFDIIARVAFQHEESGEVRQTQMFYDGNETWKFRFTGTRTGLWTFLTSSEEANLDGYNGKILIHPNEDPDIYGFLVNHGNKFARQTGENGELEAFLYNIWQSGHIMVNSWYNNPDLQQNLDEIIATFLDKHGMTVLYSGSIGNRWFNLETMAWDEHDQENPDIRTFEALERAITYLHSRGYHLHIWKWGDENRRQTPIGVGGINGDPDRRLQRYIAARLGPLPGWSMSYGFDLGDPNWVRGNIEKLESWSEYMQRHMGWPHLLFTRGYSPPSISGISYSSNGPGSPTGAIQTSANGPMTYEEVVSHIDSDLDRPHLYEERFIYLREFDGGPPWTDERTRRVLWWNTMAGGVGSFWGVWDGPIYQEPEPLRTHYKFWKDRFLLEMERANHLTDGYALITPDHQNLVFYKEGADSITIDLSSIPHALSVIAVDTKKVYSEIDLGLLEPGVYQWVAPYESDWALAVGFE
jgi:hypothetical protein